MKNIESLIFGVFISLFLFSMNSFSTNNKLSVLIDSSIFYQYRNPDYSLDLARRAYNMALNLEDTESQIDALNRQAYLYSKYFNKYDSAINLAYKAYAMSKNIGYKKGISEYYYNKAFIGQEGLDDDYAKEFFEKSLKIARDIDCNRLIASIQYGLSFISLDRGFYSLATNTIDDATHYFILCNDKYGVAKSYFLKSLISLKIGDPEKAKQEINKARGIYKSLEDTFYVLTCNFQEAVVEVKVQNYDKAISVLEECSLLDVSDAKSLSLKGLALKNLSDLYREKGIYDKALKFKDEYYEYIDSKFSSEKINRINNIRIQYEKDLKELERNNLELRVKKNKVIIWLIGFVFIQSLIFLIVIYNKYKVIKRTSKELNHQQQLNFEQERMLERRERERIEQSLEHKKRELAVKVFQIFQGSQLSQKILQNLKNLKLMVRTKGKAGEELRFGIQEMIKEIEFNNSIQIWKEFEIYFNEVTPGFKDWLTHAYPDLTPNEIRLCFFSKMNLKTKEISNITLQTVNTINVARKRLRKKLGINDQNVSLSSFLTLNFTKL